jgi:DNA processing protein
MLQFADKSPIQPFKEIVAYEALWAHKKTTFKSLSNLFAQHPDARPSDFVRGEEISELRDEIKKFVFGMDFTTSLLISGTFDYPPQLRDAKEPVILLYYTGILEYLKTRRVAIVGTRNPSSEGLAITDEIATKLVKDDFTIVSGLAAGIDTQAHTSAIAASGRTIAVLGTPLNRVYPKENNMLQEKIANEHLLISQVPFYRYSIQDYRINKHFFVERNKTMSALTEATLIIEAGQTSGSLTQAIAAQYQKRKLFIWDTCFRNKDITWPQEFADKGAIRVGSYEELIGHLNHD